jgi:dCMP deaminase
MGSTLTDSTIYVIKLFPCCDCARAIIQSGIKKVVCPMPDLDNPRWGDDFKIALQMFAECDIEIQYYTEDEVLLLTRLNF